MSDHRTTKVAAAGRRRIFTRGLVLNVGDDYVWQAKHRKPWLRLVLIAGAFSNSIGHAEFADGELQELLDIPRSTLNSALRAAKETELLEESSSLRCLVLHRSLAQPRESRGSYGCRFHKIGEPGRLKAPSSAVERRAQEDALAAEREADLDLSAAVARVGGRD